VETWDSAFPTMVSAVRDVSARNIPFQPDEGAGQDVSVPDISWGDWVNQVRP